MKKDIYFGDYNKNNDEPQNNQSINIPVSRNEEAIQEKLKQEKYERIIHNQNLNNQFADDEYYSQQPSRNIYNQPVGTYQPNSVQYQTPPPEKKAPQPQKKPSGCGRVFTCFLVIIAILCVGTFGYVFAMCCKTNYENVKRTDDNYKQYQFSTVYNVLLIGTDKDEGGTSRSDSMMLVSLDKKNKMIKMTSFMRDMWVEIPEHGKAKLNAAYAYGGAPLLMLTIEKNFDIYIDNYVKVDFEMFEKLIDGIGGVTVDITEAEAKFINRTTHAEVKAGTNTLNGDYALIYCRIRKLDSDFMRTQRQRKVMTSIIKQMTTQSIFKTAGAVSDILPLVTTDISPLTMTFKIFGGISLLSYGNDQLRIPCDDTYSSRTINGQAALVPNLDANKKELQKFIYGQ